MSDAPADVRYEIENGIARITINRPEVYNAFRAETCEQFNKHLEAAIQSKGPHLIEAVI